MRKEKIKFNKNFFLKIVSVLQFFIGISAIGGGIGLVATNGLGMPVMWLDQSPFGSYILPGLILVFIVGSTHLVAAVSVWKNWPNLPVYLAIAGFGMLIWIFSELYIIQIAHWLQILYFIIGLTSVIISMILMRWKANIANVYDKL